MDRPGDRDFSESLILGDYGRFFACARVSNV